MLCIIYTVFSAFHTLFCTKNYPLANCFYTFAARFEVTASLHRKSLFFMHKEGLVEIKLISIIYFKW